MLIGRGKPDLLSKDTSNLYKILPDEIPDKQTAVSMYPGHLTPEPARNINAELLLESEVHLAEVYASILKKEHHKLLETILRYKQICSTLS